MVSPLSGLWGETVKLVDRALKLCRGARQPGSDAPSAALDDRHAGKLGADSSSAQTSRAWAHGSGHSGGCCLYQ